MIETIQNTAGPQAPTKRKRKDWVYKSDYDKLDRKYKIVKRITLILLIALVIALRF